MQRSIGLRDTALKVLRQEVDDVLREDAEKAAGLEEVIEELERLQQSEAGKTEQLAGSQQHLQVGCAAASEAARLQQCFLGCILFLFIHLHHTCSSRCGVLLRPGFSLIVSSLPQT